ncbi:autophagy-related protein 27 [Irpex rosettiformis]|uniref:Autophagy-related protein 27 n=1 Tax=Irpex rosettiformis TaxID=378272 RepID=A0ACB8UFQ2_9APHY|nr:autophagy-related protein 27 [Irpex rosettiformis]
MILRYSLSVPRYLTLCVVLLFTAQQTSAQDIFDCHMTIGDKKFDLTTLGGEHTVSRERNTPPTKFKDSVTFNLCEDLKKVDGVSDKEQCPSETRACLTKTNLKENESDRITAVIQLARPDLESLKYEALPSPRKGVSLSWKGPSYPDPITSEDTPQSFNLNLYCDTETSQPNFKSYDGKELWIEWQAPAGCAMGDAPPEEPPSSDPGSGNGGSGSSSSMGSGIGYFFLLLVLAFGAYFGLGAYYNYSTYGATGLDLIPHRDFWREVPYMLRDVVSHLCSAVRPRHTSSRGGYIAV